MNERRWAHLTDGELVLAAQKGQLEAFEALFNRYHRRIFAILYGMANNPNDTADLTQEVFVRAYRDLYKLRSDGAVYAWLRTTAVNLGIDFLRRKSHVSFESLDAPPAPGAESQTREIEDWRHNPEVQLQANLREQAVQNAVSCLSPDHRAVIVMHHLEGMGVDEIAGLLSISPGTVKSRLARARDVLRRKLAAFVEAY